MKPGENRELGYGELLGRPWGQIWGRKHSQLQQGQVGIAIESPVLTLLSDIVLEYRGRLGVVSVEATQDGINVGRPSLALVERDTHFGGYEAGGEKRKRGSIGGGGRKKVWMERATAKRAGSDRIAGCLFRVGFFDCVDVRAAAGMTKADSFSDWPDRSIFGLFLHARGFPFLPYIWVLELLSP